MKKQHLKLTETDERYLTEFISKGQAPARVVRWATALLQLHQGSTLQMVVDILQVRHWAIKNSLHRCLDIG